MCSIKQLLNDNRRSFRKSDSTVENIEVGKQRSEISIKCLEARHCSSNSLFCIILRNNKGLLCRKYFQTSIDKVKEIQLITVK